MTKVEDIELSPEELAEVAKESDEFNQRLELGDGPDPAMESPKEAYNRGV